MTPWRGILIDEQMTGRTEERPATARRLEHLRLSGWLKRQGDREWMQRAARTSFDYWLLDGEAALACQALYHLFLTHLVWVAATVNVHSALLETNEGKLLPRSATTSTSATGGSAILIPYTLRVIKTQPEEAGKVDRII